MNSALIWIHEEALRRSHPVFAAAPKDTQAIFVWDNDHLQKLGYCLKRLVFLYETLCELDVDILWGETVDIIKHLGPSKVFIPASSTNHLVLLTEKISLVADVETVKDEMFVPVSEDSDPTRFFKYWAVAKQTAFLVNGGFGA